MVAGLVGIMLAAGFGLIGLPLGILLGLFVGLLNMVPYLQIIGLIPASLVAILHSLAQGDPWWQMLVLAALVFAVVQTIQDTVLIPKIMGRVTGLSPAMILLSLSIWGKLLGFFGLLVALPMTCLLLAYYRRFLAPPAGDEPPATPAPAP
jgi:predicted PurR-regulated permease PerM